jgi:glutaredoxin
MRNLITVYSRHGCHLCEVASESLLRLQAELDFDIETKFIDGNPELEDRYGEEIPVIQIDGEHHDFFRVDPDRFRSSLATHRLRQ